MAIRELELALRSIVTHALIGYEDINPKDVDSIVEQSAKLLTLATDNSPLTAAAPEMYQMLVKIKSAMRDAREEASYYDGPDAQPAEPGPVEAALILLVDQIQYQLPDEVLRPSFVGGSDNLPF